MKLADESAELVDLSLGAGDLGGEELVEAPLDRPATLAIPDVDEIGDLLEAATELLRPATKASRAMASSS